MDAIYVGALERAHGDDERAGQQISVGCEEIGEVGIVQGIRGNGRANDWIAHAGQWQGQGKEEKERRSQGRGHTISKDGITEYQKDHVRDEERASSCEASA